MRVPMIATKNMTYGTRALKAEEPFDANDRSQARLLTALGRATVAKGKPVAERTAGLAELRAAYQEKYGKRPFHGWDEDTLREKIADAE
jgi:hypothetical protein